MMALQGTTCSLEAITQAEGSQGPPMHKTIKGGASEKQKPPRGVAQHIPLPSDDYL